MRRALILLAAFSCSTPLLAVTRMTVAAFDQMLASRLAAHESDTDTAQKIAGIELTERLTSANVANLKKTLQMGPLTEIAVEMQVDSSAFLNPPASELPQKDVPAVPEQQAMLNAAVHFVSTTFQHLPDFLAERQTSSYDNSPVVVTHSGWAPPNGLLHTAGTFKQLVTYRGGREISLSNLTANGKSTQSGPAPSGLSSSGEFGPVLATILRDASKGSIQWSHWEQGPMGPVAVFAYKVPQPASHYQVDYCCVRGSEDPKSYQGSKEQNLANAYHGTPAYHGEIFLEPATGSIERLTLEAEFDPENAITAAQVSVSYDSVAIGGQSYICPVQSLAISDARTRLGGDMSDRTILRINEVTFAHYHRFGTSSRILVEGESQ
jgi:hypothetical protein